MSIQELLDHASKVVDLPQIDAERCVHALIEQASCQACVDVCPHNAWFLSDEAFGLDSGICDGCGLCQPACPQLAITHEHQPELRSFKGRDIAIVACERSGAEGEGVIPCIHSLDLSALLDVQRQGARILMYARGDCGACDRAQTARSFEKLVANFTRFASGHQLPQLRVRKYTAQEWKERRKHLTHEAQGKGYSRRGFLRGFLGKAVEHGLNQRGSSPVSRQQATTVASTLPETSVQGWFPHVPRIDPNACSGCDACVKVCPHAAIRLGSDPFHYAVDARCCSGCGMCVDVCDANAVSVQEWSQAEGQIVALQKSRCTACGVPFHRPKLDKSDKALCRICAQQGHHKKLFQVLED